MTFAAPTRPGGGPPGTDDEATRRRDDEATASQTDHEIPETTPASAPPVGDGPNADVAALFDEIAPVADRLGSILSLGLDRRWRAAIVDQTLIRPGDAVIDVAAGTGRLATALADRVGPFGRVVAVDISPAMVERGSAGTRDIVQLEFLLGDALALPFENGRFDAATIAFGLGTLADLPSGLAELRRVVRPGGRVVCLEPTLPRPRWWGRIYHRTARRLAPLAVSVAGRRSQYRRLAALVRNVPDADTLADLMRSAGLVEVEHRRLGLGAVALHAGKVPEV
jgi:demethylmenaquinone methyltransferase / 2-methoxy-6-polyprenyl-1,4-benzoquinol methylase